MIYWERKLPALLVIITHLFVVSSRQRFKNQEFDDRLRCEKSMLCKIGRMFTQWQNTNVYIACKKKMKRRLTVSMLYPE